MASIARGAVFRWLHLTDLHVGAPGQEHLWPGVKARLFGDLEWLHEDSGSWDAVLFTGDVTRAGTEQQFAKAGTLLEEIYKHIESLGSRPLFLAVPGNHDLVRPEHSDSGVSAVCRWQSDRAVVERFWQDPDSELRQAVKVAFGEYTNWWRTHPRRPKAVCAGLLPGDFSVTLQKDGFRLGIVGLNTAFLQLTDGPYERKLALDVRQFHAATGGDDGVSWAQSHHACVLMTHHPPAWLNSEALQQLEGEIADHGRFAIHLCGHMHATAYRQISEGGTEPRRLWQGNSLYSTHSYFENGSAATKRNHGYAVGEIQMLGESGELTFWPREDRAQGTERQLVPDHSVRLADGKEHTNPTHVSLNITQRKRPGVSVRWLWVAGALMIAGIVGLGLQQNCSAPPEPPAAASPASASVSERVLTYWLLANEAPSSFVSENRPFKKGDRPWLCVASPQTGHLYILNEGPKPRAGLPSYAILYPTPDVQATSGSLIEAKVRLYFDQEAGTERLWMVWATRPLPDLDAVRHLVNDEDQGVITEPAQIRAIQALLNLHSASSVSVVKGERGTLVSGVGQVLIKCVMLDHR